MSSRYDGDPRVVANEGGSFHLPGGHDSWTVQQVGGEWRATADHGEYLNPPYWAGASAEDAIAQIIGEPQNTNSPTSDDGNDDTDGM